MIFFDNENPLDDLAGIIREANPEIAHLITGETIEVDNLVAIDPNVNDGFNTRCEIRTTGTYDAVGVVVVRYNRISLRTALLADNYYLHIPITTDKNNQSAYDIAAPLISKALGTKFKVDGDYRDYTRTTGLTVAKGETANAYIDVYSLSLRYVPERIHFKVYGLGKALEVCVIDPAAYPFTRETDNALWFGGSERKQYGTSPYTVDTKQRSVYTTIANIDFTSVWGTDPNNAIELTNDPELLTYQFTEEAFEKINLLLATQNLPPLPNPYFNAWNRSSANVNHSLNYGTLNYLMYIKQSDCDWDWTNGADLFAETTTWADNMAFCYRV